MFQQANQQWFVEGRTKKALENYRAAAQEEPVNPVILYQLARVLLAFSQPGEARSLLARAESHIEQLSPFGVKALRMEIAKLAQPVAYRTPIHDLGADLDIDELDRLTLSHDRWLQVAFAASEREMFSLSAIAYGMSIGSFRVLELEEDEREMWRKARNAWNALSVMDKDCDPTLPLPEPKTTTLVDAPRPPSPSQDLKLTQAPRPNALVSEFAPLEVRIAVAPVASGVGDPLKLELTLANLSSRLVAVNGRLLLNHHNSPPQFVEIYLSIEGPPGYENTVFYHVRTGPPDPAHFVLLAPNEKIAKDYRLQQFESLHMPGSYRLWVTYRNTVHSSVRGIPLFVGSVSSNLVTLVRD